LSSFIILLATLATGCLGNARTQQREIVGAERERLVKIAKQELRRRHLVLPHDHDVVVENGEIGNEIAPLPRKVYGVWFRFTYRGKREVFYSVLIDKRSGRIDQVSDLRTAKLQAF
jgi:hypothetical protein